MQPEAVAASAENPRIPAFRKRNVAIGQKNAVLSRLDSKKKKKRCDRALDLISQQLVLLHLEGLSTQEIAETTGISATNVSTKLSRLRASLAASQSEEP